MKQEYSLMVILFGLKIKMPKVNIADITSVTNVVIKKIKFVIYVELGKFSNLYAWSNTTMVMDYGQENTFVQAAIINIIDPIEIEI